MNGFIQAAVKLLRSGHLVAFPTETVYGLGADASNEKAIQKIYLAKNRPPDHPVIVHIANISQLSEWAREISPFALLLAKHFWPGPLTLILKKSAGVSPFITGNQDTIGVRVPAHPMARELLTAFGGGVAAPSANRFGRISPTTAAAVREELGNDVDLILEGGRCEIGLESTIVDVSQDEPVILRPGMITKKQIESVLQHSVGMARKNSPRVSGSLSSHYAPQTPTLLMTTNDLASYLQQVPEIDLPIAVLMHTKISLPNKNIFLITMPNIVEDYARDLYFMLRELDKKNFRKIVIESVPSDEAWYGILDRLQRSTARINGT